MFSLFLCNGIELMKQFDMAWSDMINMSGPSKWNDLNQFVYDVIRTWNEMIYN